MEGTIIISRDLEDSAPKHQFYTTRGLLPYYEMSYTLSDTFYMRARAADPGLIPS